MSTSNEKAIGELVDRMVSISRLDTLDEVRNELVKMRAGTLIAERHYAYGLAMVMIDRLRSTDGGKE